MSHTNLSQADMWQAVLEHDEQFDGTFVYAVRTTGIFCRPSCKSRHPNRHNVEFFHSSDEAQQAGYRACKRCQPDASLDPSHQRVEEMCRYIETHAPEGPITLTDLGQTFHLSPFHLQRTFKRVMGITPREYADAVRVRAFKEHLRNEDTVTEAVFAAGYTSNSQLYARVDDQLGMTPSEYQTGGPSAIRYTTAISPLGVILVAATERGICAVRIGDTAEQLVSDLRAEFPAAHVTAQDNALRPVLDSLLRHLAGERPRLDLPLDIQATAFQKRVWEALRRIPYGETRTYADIARAINQPGATRAVGNACASNPVAIIIPCHRVIRHDGHIGNYRWGAERKKRLLAIERPSQPTPESA
ncbi:MAG: bifunctional DNA-binding transcriptional regulator/O6-methylguanine-DNA methyltransferase Ada [Rubrivivax sp.]|nr:bifunctional DNA-binding transcriptional regulator/O6-methylguanine-DNA methyltransferase Ada [Rubrivivax sp.]